METIRILNVIRSMKMGGAQAIIMNLYRNIDRKQVQFDFLVNEEGMFDSEIRKLGGRIFLLPYLTEIGPMAYSKKLKAFFIEHPEYRIVHSHMNQVTGIILQVAKKANVPIKIAHAHSTSNENGLLGKIYKKYLQNKINKTTDYRFACSEEAASWLYREDASKAIILKNGIETKKYQFSIEKRRQIRNELQIEEKEFVIGHVGSFREAKNHVFLVKIFYEFQKKYPNSKLVLVGEGELISKIQQLVKELKMEAKVIFTGVKNNAEDYLNAFDFFVFPSLFEGFGMALLEAQCNGLKCYTSQGVPKEVNVTGNVQFLPLTLSAEDWAEQIAKGIGYKRVSKDNEVRKAGYDILEIAKKLEKFYIEK